MFGFWCIVTAVVLFPFFGDRVRYIGLFSVVALVPNFASETPVETEDK